MASSEGQTELLSGWSCVVHQPSEDPEPSELPSTVDIAAFSAGLGVEPAGSNASTNHCDASDSDSDSESGSHGSGSGSGSGSASDSSDSDSSSTSSSSRSRSPSPSPKFSVTSQTHDQLRMTIATVRKTTAELPASTVNTGDKSHAPPSKERRCSSSDSCDSSDSDSSDAVAAAPAPPPPEPKAGAKSAPVKASAVVSAPASVSQSNNNNNNVETGASKVVVAAPLMVRSTRQRRPPPPLAPPAERRLERRSARSREHAAKDKDKEVSPRVLRERARLKRKKMAALPTSRSSPRSSSDSQDSDADSVMLSACSLQEIRQEDLAAILPDQQECDAFDAFEENAKNSPAAGDASASDIELPQQAVNAIIQRTTESYSESESHPPPNTNLFANSLIQQFHIVNSGQENTTKNGTKHTVKPGDADKKKRGRPKKVVKKAQPLEYCGDPNVSPDSGIQNSPDHVSSPECSPLPMSKSKFENKTKSIKKEPLGKMTVTSNRFDRILYGHSDRVLYPPRRKVGRPVSKKGPGRPPKNKSCENKPKLPKAVEVKAAKVVGKKKEVLQTNNQPGIGTIEKSKEKEKSTNLNEICERISKRLEEKKPKIALTTSSKATKNKYLTLKNEKLMHSKHKHKKHKKCKFKILKPLAAPQPADPKLTVEIEKLVNEFFRLCSISPMVASKSKENVPEVGKVLKKVSKKRKVSDYNERKKKKVVAETSPNEQRLPLKKRHYHLTSTNSVSEIKEKEKNEEDVPDEKIEEVEEVTENAEVAFSNNNEYDLKTSHIDEAIEACITKYAGVTPIKQDKVEPSEVETSEEKPMTTPKKRHRLEQFSPELCVEEEQREGLETVVNEIRMKRNLNSSGKKTSDLIATMKKKTKLDELTSNLSSKLVEAEEAKRRRDLEKEVKLPVCKKAKSAETKDLPLVVADEKPTGIFLPTVDLEALEPIKPVKEVEPAKEGKPETVVSPVRTVNIKEVKRKVRKRRAINRTGFPTVKKKKKKVAPVVTTQVAKVCDRVPKEGEEYSSFVERTELPKPDDIEEDDELSGMKWEAISECDSLPQEDRIDFDIKAERASLKSRNESPMTTSSMEDVSLHERLAKLRQPKKFDKKLKHLRDVSPASRESSASGDDSKRTKKHPRWRKRYLAAGLFSDYYKEDEAKRQEVPKKLQYTSDEHPYGLLPAPYHCGKYLRCRKIPFQLPYDLWYQHTHSQLPGRDIVPSWNYRKIRSNVYNVKNTLNACEPQACNCSPTSNCGDDCINRLVLAECPASHKCNNQRIQKHEWAPGLDKFMTESKGWGIQTNEPIKSGEFILEYVGEVVSDQEFKERMATRYVHDTHHYCLHLDGGLVIDGHRMGGDGRFVNHSCEPNCEIQKWSVNGQFRMALFSLRDIKAGEELTYDYNFSLFNMADGQECKCGSDDCRGVIGGKSQRVRQSQAQAMLAQASARVGRPRKTQAKKAAQSVKVANPTLQQANTSVMPPVKISSTQQTFIKEHHCFLLRNLKRIKKLRDRSGGSNVSVPRVQTSTPTNQNNQGAVFLSQLNALRQPRNMITRRVAQVKDDPELKKTVRLANLLRNIFNVLIEAKDEKNEKLSSAFMLLPSKRKQPEYYQKITDPIDLTTIEQAITSGTYKTFESFEADLNKLFNNAVKFYGRSDDLGIASARLKKVYNDTKTNSLGEIENVLGVKPPTKFMSNKKKNEEEDIIRCICGMYKDEGLMIQCERCLVWQHCECVKADDNAASYHCEQCVPRVVDYEIALDEYTEHNHRYYMTLMRDDLQLRQGDTVYVLRDIAIPGTEKKHTYDTIGEVKYSDLDIFRIERLWKDSKTGQRFAYGHHYLRPHETYHEPSRKFFSNEVMRVPLYEAVPVELIISHCWVMDLNTYCKGRPIGAPEEHIYICEYRVDKNARLFSKVSKSKFPICCKSYAFERFAERLKVTRTYTPHDLDPAFLKQRGRKPHDAEEVKVVEPQAPVVVHPIIKTPADKKARVNAILLKLLSKCPSKHPLDVTYLLEGGRRRKNREEKK